MYLGIAQGIATEKDIIAESWKADSFSYMWVFVFYSNVMSHTHQS